MTHNPSPTPPKDSWILDTGATRSVRDTKPDENSFMGIKVIHVVESTMHESAILEAFRLKQELDRVCAENESLKAEISELKRKLNER